MNRNQTNRNYYQNHQEKLRVQRKEKYQVEKKKKQEVEYHQISKYSQAENYKILISWKEYITLNSEKHQKWLDFNWTLRDCGQDIKEGLGNVIIIMKLREAADNLIRDYWVTAKNEVSKGKNWNSLDYEQQQKLIRYWGYEKARIENNLLTLTEQLEQQSQEYEQEITLAKFHQERGKIKCSCSDCETKNEIQDQVKAERDKILADYEAQQKAEKEKPILVEGECANCYQYKKVDAESGLCRKCLNKS